MKRVLLQVALAVPVVALASCVDAATDGAPAPRREAVAATSSQPTPVGPVAGPGPQLCADPVNLPNPVFMSFGETQIPLIRQLGAQLRANENITLVWRAAGSCTNLQSLYDNTAMTTQLSYIPAGYDGTSTPPLCDPGLAGIAPDIADSVVFVEACPLTKPADVGDFFAAVQPFAFVVPLASAQHAIFAEEAYFIFGFGAIEGMVTPWTDPALTYILGPAKGTILNLAAMINVPVGKWKGTVEPTLDQLSTDVGASIDPDATIGILGSGTYEEHRDEIRPLAFNAYRQDLAYFPDSTETSLDKQNVRDGHYTPWSYTHWLARVDGSGNVIDPEARRVIDLIVGEDVTPVPTFDPIELQIDAHFVPVCAMKVQRSFEGGDLSLFDPEVPCHCFFESKTSTAGPNCTECVDSSTCGGGVCSHGYCEGT